MNENEVKEEVFETVEMIPEETGNGILGKVIVGAVLAAAAGVGAWVYKKRKDKKQEEIHEDDFEDDILDEETDDTSDVEVRR